jgi:predicted glycogen debranching enzyme
MAKRQQPVSLQENVAAPEAQAPPAIEFGRDICQSLEEAEQREWLVTNGIGGFASGTISGILTRRYHGLLFAALQPPAGRTLLVSKLDEFARYKDVDYDLSSNRWLSGAIEPKGYLNISNFRLDGTTPVWNFALGDALLEKRICMQQGENTTYVQYTLLKASGPVALRLKCLVNYRDFHSLTDAGDWHLQIEPIQHGARVTAFDGAMPFYILSANAALEICQEWYRGFFLPLERYRGLDDHEDHLLAAILRVDLQPDQSVTIALTTRPDAELDGARTFTQRAAGERELLATWAGSDPHAASAAPAWIRQLVLAADQFIVQRNLPEAPDGRTVIAGYHWFGDWGRDTMISLPGLALATGRYEIARKILLAFAPYIDQGMLPNNFPDAGGKPAYNSVDATLWYFEAVRQYFAATQDLSTLEKLFPALKQIIEWHVKGTRYQIHIDPADGLLYAGEPGVQLTWMDAKVGDWVVTPRIGKPIEVNALWYNALETMAAFAALLGKSPAAFAEMAAVAKNNFGKFWNAQTGYCYDVIAAPGVGNDAALRPNQIFAVSLPKSPLAPEKQKAVVDICASRLLTPCGLRSLAQSDHAYQGRYSGSPLQRDGAYHQGTVWGWLIGPFVDAHLRVYKDRNAAMAFVETLGKQIGSYGLGTLGEIFDGDPPFSPRGCIAQAWTVAEILRAWRATS